MKFCKFCGKQLDNEANFCPYCMQKQNLTSTPAEPGAKKMSPVLIAAIALGAAAVLTVGGFFVFKFVILKPKNSSSVSSKSGSSSISESSDVLSDAVDSSFPEGVSGGHDNNGSVSGSGEGAQGEGSTANGSVAAPAGGSANGSVGGSTGGSTGGSARGSVNGSAGGAAGSTGGSSGGSANASAGSSTAGSAGGSTGGSTGGSASTSSGGSTGGSKNNNPCANGHHWVAITTTVHHDELGHNESVLVSPEVRWYRCPVCSTQFYSKNDYYSHFDSTHTSWPESHLRESYTHGTAERAQYEDKWVVDRAAYDEEVTIGYKCSVCNTTK